MPGEVVGPFPPSSTWAVGAGLDGRLAAGISAAVSAEMTRYAAARGGGSLPPLVWDRVSDGAVVGAAREVSSAEVVEQALRPWARALGLARQPARLTPVAGAVEFAGWVDGVHVRVWGLAFPESGTVVPGPPSRQRSDRLATRQGGLERSEGGC